MKQRPDGSVKVRACRCWVCSGRHVPGGRVYYMTCQKCPYRDNHVGWNTAMIFANMHGWKHVRPDARRAR